MTKGNAAAVWMDVRELQPWARNPVIHEDDQVAELEALIASSVWTAPIVARTSDRRVIAGHGRRLAALRAMERDPGWKLSDAPRPGMVPVRLVEVDDATADRLTLADNAMTKASAWDDAELAEILRGLGDAAEGIGFDEAELAEMLRTLEPDAPAATDDVPEVQVEVHSKPGEVYALGPHRLWCGDNADPTIRAAACAGVGAVVTDPPYGIGASSQTMGLGQSSKPRSQRLSNVQEWDASAPPVAWLLDVAPAVVVWGGNYFADLPPSPNWLVWHKKNDGRSFAEAELAWTNCSPLVRLLQHHWSGETKEHITQKPLAVMVWSVGFVPDGATVLDPYGGSGTTLLACAQTGRVARVIELDPRYCDVIRRRWTRYAREAGIDAGPGALDG